MYKYIKPKKCFSYEKHERTFHSIVSEIIELICVVLLLFSGFFIYDSILVKKSTQIDKFKKEYKPVIQEDTKKASLSELQEINPDIMAWLTIDDTTIDYPILHNTQQYSYINLDYEGKSSLAGSLYTDVKSDRYFNDYYTIVYGHHMDGGMMLGALDYYRDGKYLNEHKTGTLIAEDKIYDLTVLCMLHINAYNKLYSKTTVEQFNIFKANDGGKEFSYLSGNLDAEYNKLLILSTCHGGGMDRYILILSMEERK